MSISGGGSKEKAIAVSMPLPQQRKIWNKITPYVMEGLNQPANAYPREMYVPTTSTEEQYLQDVASMRTGELAGVFQGEVPYDIGPEFAEMFYQEAVKPMAMKEFEEVTMPSIKASYAGPGYYSSSRQLTETKAAQDLSTQLAAARAQLYYQEEQAKREAIEKAVERQLGAEALALGQEYKAGELTRDIAQEQVMADLQRWLMGEEVDGESMALYSPYFQMALQLLGFEGISASKSSGQSFSGGGGMS